MQHNYGPKPRSRSTTEQLQKKERCHLKFAKEQIPQHWWQNIPWTDENLSGILWKENTTIKTLSQL